MSNIIITKNFQQKEVNSIISSKEVGILAVNGSLLISENQVQKPNLTTKAQALRSMRDDKFFGRRKFLSLDKDITDDKDFIQSVMQMAPYYYWCENFPKFGKENYQYLFKALHFDHSMEDFNNLPEKAKNHIKVINSQLFTNYPESVQYYFCQSNTIYYSDGATEKCSLQSFLIRNSLNEGTDYYSDMLGHHSSKVGVLSSLVYEREKWKNLLNSRNDDAGLSILFSCSSFSTILGLIYKIEEQDPYNDISSNFLVDLLTSIMREQWLKKNAIIRFFTKYCLDRKNKANYIKLENKTRLLESCETMD